jgi:hypothetical protein
VLRFRYHITPKRVGWRSRYHSVTYRQLAVCGSETILFELLVRMWLCIHSVVQMTAVFAATLLWLLAEHDAFLQPGFFGSTEVEVRDDIVNLTFTMLVEPEVYQVGWVLMHYTLTLGEEVHWLAFETSEDSIGLPHTIVGGWAPSAKRRSSGWRH